MHVQSSVNGDPSVPRTKHSMDLVHMPWVSYTNGVMTASFHGFSASIWDGCPSSYPSSCESIVLSINPLSADCNGLAVYHISS